MRNFEDQTEEPAFFGRVKATKKCVRMAKILKKEEFFKLTNCVAKYTCVYYVAMNCLQSETLRISDHKWKSAMEEYGDKTQAGFRAELHPL